MLLCVAVFQMICHLGQLQVETMTTALPFSGRPSIIFYPQYSSIIYCSDLAMVIAWLQISKYIQMYLLFCGHGGHGDINI